MLRQQPRPLLNNRSHPLYVIFLVPTINRVTKISEKEILEIMRLMTLGKVCDAWYDLDEG